MTPKEKANKLCMRFLIQTSTDIPYGVNKSIAKECALIAVDEIIMQIYNIDHQHRAFYNNETGFYSYSDSIELIFWKEVKQEIEKL